MNKEQYLIKVINKNDVSFEDRYDGIPYVIPAGGSVNIPYEAACHIFGARFAPGDEGHTDNYRDSVFLHLQRRWGWNRPKEIAGKKELFSNLEFKLIALSLVERVVADELGEPRPKTKGMIKKSKQADEEEVA